MFRKILSATTATIFSFLMAGTAQATTVLVSTGSSYGYGLGNWANMTAAMDTATGGNVITTSGFGNLSQMLTYDAIWLDQRWTSGVLTATERSNIASFIGTGRKVVMIGENTSWTGWNNQLMSIVGGSFSGDVSGTANTILNDALTAGVNSVLLPTGGLVVSGGTALFDKDFAALWGTNVLTVLDVNVMSDSYWNSQNNARFNTNVANWIADSNSSSVPEPTTLLLAGLGLAGLGFSRRKKA